MTSLRYLLVAAALFGCNKTNGQFCEGHPDDPSCSTVDIDAAPMGCTSSTECTDGAAGVCDTANHVCVECLAPSDVAACTGIEPVCGTDHSCHACSSHSECSSNACAPDGSCAAEASVAYVSPAGSGELCTKASPCATLDKALGKNTPFIKFATGTVTNSAVTTIDGKAVTILADSGAKLSRSTAGTILEVKNAGADVSIYDLEISGGLGTDGHGLVQSSSGGSPKTHLVHTKLSLNGGTGITLSSGTLSIERSMISNNTAGGISMSSGATLSAVNNFIDHNGTNTSGLGGVLIPNGANVTKFEFNTIVDNTTGNGSTTAGGVVCDVTFAASSNVIFHNSGGSSGTTQTVGICTYGNSYVAAGTAGADDTLKFVHSATAPFDYHLTAATPATILNAAGNCTGADFDGDARPNGTACDLGADEFKP